LLSTPDADVDADVVLVWRDAVLRRPLPLLPLPLLLPEEDPNPSFIHASSASLPLLFSSVFVPSAAAPVPAPVVELYDDDGDDDGDDVEEVPRDEYDDDDDDDDDERLLPRRPPLAAYSSLAPP